METTVINFDPEVNATLIRIFELQKAIDTIKNTKDEYFSENEDFGLSLLLNLVEEEKFLKAELKKVWESIPDLDKQVEEMFTGGFDEE
jgi:hypothetical protein